MHGSIVPAPMRPLHCGRWLLEPLTVAHADAMFVVLDDPALYTHLDHGPPPSLAHLRSVYARWEQRRSPDGSEQWLNWVLREPGRPPVGTVQATVLPGASAWVAYVIGTAHQGRGLATRATAVMIEHLGAAYGVQRVLACVEAAHRRSIALLERLGFQPASQGERDGHALTPSERLYVAAVPQVARVR